MQTTFAAFAGFALVTSGCAPSEPTANKPGPTASWSAVALAGIAAGEYAPRRDQDGFRALNRAQDLRAAFTASGVSVAPRRGGTPEVTLSLLTWGREGAIEDAEVSSPEEGACLANGAADAFGECLHRVSYPRPGLDEWWENRPEGLEQGFTVTAPPGGEGALIFELGVTGAEVEVGNDGALLRPGAEEQRAGAQPLRYAGLWAVDSLGRGLPAWMEETAGGLRLVIDDEGAIGTLTIDPLLTTAASTVESGQASAGLGVSVAAAGDVNGDGYGDVVAGAPGFDDGSADEGAAFVYLGSATGLAASAAWTAEADQDGAQFGTSVASAGDVNGDGYGDLVVGAPDYDGGSGDEGAVFIYLGGATGLAASPAWTGTASQVAASFGATVAAAGDVNGDGYGDLLVGAPDYDGGETDEGAAFVYLGSASGLASSAAWTTEANQASAHFGSSVAPAGDADGDGYDDVMVGAPDYDHGSTDEGRAYVFLGGETGLRTIAAWTVESDQAGARFGASVAAAGDVDHDGYGDLLVGAPTYDGGATDEGRVSLYLGTSSGPATSATWTAEGDQASADFGVSVASAGDVNGDGYADVVVGADLYEVDATDEGGVFVYLGGALGLATSPVWTTVSGQASAGLGRSVAPAGDVNGDGYGDVIAGAPAWDGDATDEGRVYLNLGSASGPAKLAAWTLSVETQTALGYSVAAAGDVNGDGYGDVIVGAPDEDDEPDEDAYEGRAYVYLGAPAGLASTAAWVAAPGQAGAHFGAAVSSAGDVNGDGFADVLVGADLYDGGEADVGRVWLYLGGASGLATAAAWSAESDQAYAHFGSAVACAGDVNGDGYADVVIGALDFGNGETDEGAAFLYLGGASGLAPSPAWTAEAEQANAHLGQSVAAAGDVDGDGYGDILVGAPGYDGAETDVGAAFVYLGSASGPAAGAAWTTEGDKADAGHGSSVAAAGDVNGDGYGDIVVGAPARGDGSSEGAAFVYHGSASGLATSANWTATSGQASALFGGSVAPAGDVNGDGYADVVVGAASYDDGPVDGGGVFVYFGGSAGLAASTGWTARSDQTSDQASARLGFSVACAGDVNGDGYGDVIAGAPAAGGTTGGQVQLYLGSGPGLGAEAAVIAAPISGSYFGTSVAAAGDVNGDGYGDVLIGAPYCDDGSSYEGCVYLYLGNATGLSATAAWSAESNQEYAYFGESVASAGDVNGDGYGDVIIGASNYDNGETDEGAAFVYLGSAAGLALSPAWTAESDQASAEFGSAVASAGDVNGDGYGDVVVGAPRYNHTANDEGRVYVYLGSATGLGTSVGWSDGPEQGYAYFGTSVASAGDVNGDGYDDLIVGAYGYYTHFDDEGRAFVYLGSASGLSTPAWWVNGGQSDAYLGYSVASAGDVNGDGYDDVIVGAYQYDGGSSNEGRASVYLGNAWGLDTYASWTAEPDQSSASFGRQVAAAGDVNGDGYGDVVVRGSSCAGGATSRGGACVYLGSAAGLATTPAWAAASNPSFVESSASVSSAGDVNGDGYGDLVVGVPSYNDGSGYGGALLFLGNGADGAPAPSRPQARQPGTLTAIAAGLTSASSDRFDVALGSARSSWGAGSVALQVEVKPLGTLFDGTDLATGAWTSVGAAETSLQETLDGLAPATGYHWRARVLSSPAEGRPQGWGHWVYGGRSGDAQGGHVYTAGTPATMYEDHDGDGYGDPATATTPRTGPQEEYVDNGDDCNDGASNILPGGTELCDNYQVDEDCDGLSDNDDPSATGLSTWYLDTDADGYGGATTVLSCDPPTGYAGSYGDCDDTDTDVHPGSIERCDAADADEDCDGLADDDDDSAQARATWYLDADGDGAAGTTAHRFCDPPANYLATSTDCDDTDPARSPSAIEVCDPLNTDEDCDGLVDDVDPSATGQVPFFADVDGDGYGGAALASACDLHAGYAATSTDCDDTNSAIHPGGTEICDPSDTDEDCDGLADDADADATGQETFYLDADGDGYGGSATTDACELPGGATRTSTDCDDADPATHPGAAEADCKDPHDYNCDGSTGSTDADADGWTACEDCNDADAAMSPDATEQVGDGVDQDCDGAERCYADADGDGARAATVVDSADPDCADLGEALGSAATDCDEADAASHPGATELAGDGVDEDCDGTELCFVDADDDGYVADGAATTPSTHLACDRRGEADETAGAGDCDDEDANFHPNAVEDDCADPNDYNCDGSTGFADADGDGWVACEDCDDTRRAVNPSAGEVAGDGVDEDCDGVELCYVDADEDGYVAEGDVTTASSHFACTGTGEADATASRGDCEDSDPATHPGAAEPDCTDPHDYNCDGSTGYADVDADGWAACADCDDADAAVNPEAIDTPRDGVDQDCDGADAGPSAGTHEDTGGGGKDGGCGCTSTDAEAPVWTLLTLFAFARRSRSRPSASAGETPSMGRLARSTTGRLERPPRPTRRVPPHHGR